MCSDHTEPQKLMPAASQMRCLPKLESVSMVKHGRLHPSQLAGNRRLFLF